jgi:hypothetical protein
VPDHEVDTPISEHEIKERIAALASLSPMLYETARISAAASLNMRVDVLDRFVREARKAEGNDTAPPLYPHWVVEPWAEPVETDALLREIVQRINRHIVCSPGDTLAAALWVALSWVHDTATFSPLLVATSAEPMSGKTTLLRVISFLCPRSARWKFPKRRFIAR